MFPIFVIILDVLRFESFSMKQKPCELLKKQQRGIQKERKPLNRIDRIMVIVFAQMYAVI
ncbi:MAG: hypothetical protein SVW57_02180 [Thermodesulfobacteriota bacterium]|nr:hypothetical protein [Thermodesulfobacteriota bacterium]